MNELLDRIGLILNFVAGFLLAPELIGIEKIKKAESYLEEKSKSVKQLIEKTITKNFKLFPINKPLSFNRVVAFSLLITCFGVLIWIVFSLSRQFSLFVNPKNFFRLVQLDTSFRDRVYPLIFLKLFVSLYFAFIVYMNNYSKIIKGLLCVMIIIFFMNMGIGIAVYVIYFAVVFGFISFLQVLVLFVFVGLQKISGYIVDTLEGEERLQAILVTVGIALYILGNIIQFWATYL